MISASSAAARSASSLTTTRSNSPAAATSVSAMPSRRAMAASLSVPLPLRRRPSSLERGRRDEDQARLRHGFTDGPGTAKLDLEDDVVAPRELLDDLPAQRPVQVAAVFYPLHERPLPDRPGEGVAGQEVILATVRLAGARRTRRGRHGQGEVVEARSKQADDGALPGARGPRDHEDAGNALSPRRRRAARNADDRTVRPPSCWG